MRKCICLLSLVCLSTYACGSEGLSGAETFTNSQGMKMVRVEPGTFMMGSEDGEWDERPVHRVSVSRPFFMAATEVTNAQFELFDPQHKQLRGKLGFSSDNDEAVVFVSWHDAVAFCKWLTAKEGKPYRLPTEAEWEYACRAGTTTAYHTGDALPEAFHKNVRDSWFPGGLPGAEVDDDVSLRVGESPANPWGLQDMHGNVEEWCLDWYGPYADGPQTDPVGRAEGDFRVTRGGSHSTTLEFLRSTNRSGTLPEDRSWLIGFRVVQAEMPSTATLPALPPPRNARDVSQTIQRDLTEGPDPAVPYFHGPRIYVKPPQAPDCPIFNRHNHCPAVTECPNGDLLAVWYTCQGEPGRELGIVASRLPYGDDEWQTASDFWDAPDRNDHASALFRDRRSGTLYHFNGLGAAGTWGALATIMRTSTDSGATWSKARLIMPEHGLHHMPIESVFRTKDGTILVPCDAVTGGSGGSAVLLSRDNGATWTDPGEGRPQPTFATGTTGAWIAGIHAGVVQLNDGRLLALGRGDTIDGHMPMSISVDMGKTWTYKASPLPPIGGGQRLALLRLREGPIFLASFANKSMTFTDANGTTYEGSGLFAALSEDEGETWRITRLITAGGPPQRVDGGGNTGAFTMSATSAEPRGYLSVCQASDDVIHLISSKQHYAFNLAWVRTPAPTPPPPPKPDDLAIKAELQITLTANRLPSAAGWRFTGSGTTEAAAVTVEEAGLVVRPGPGQRARWAKTPTEKLPDLDPERGYTAEIRLAVTRSNAKTRGIDFETYAAGRRHFITITRTGVYAFDGGFRELAEGLDNHTATHTYRLAVQPDGRAQVFRDGIRLGMVEAHGSQDIDSDRYLQWGEGAGASEAEAVVTSVAYDPTGPYTPQAAE